MLDMTPVDWAVKPQHEQTNDLNSVDWAIKLKLLWVFFSVFFVQFYASELLKSYLFCNKLMKNFKWSNIIFKCIKKCTDLEYMLKKHIFCLMQSV